MNSNGYTAPRIQVHTAHRGTQGDVSVFDALFNIPQARRRFRDCCSCSFIQHLAAGSLADKSFHEFLVDETCCLAAILEAVQSCSSSKLRAAELATMQSMIENEISLCSGLIEDLTSRGAEPVSKQARSSQSNLDAYNKLSGRAKGSVEDAEIFMNLLLLCAPRFQLYTLLASFSLSSRGGGSHGQFHKWIQFYLSENSQDFMSSLRGFFPAAIEGFATTETQYLAGLDMAVSSFVTRAVLPATSAIACVPAVLPPRVLIIAGSDSGGGAGIQADMKACDANGVFSTTAITALTAQNTRGVHGIHPIPSEFVRAQMEAVLSDIGADAVKTGMLANKELVEAVAEQLKSQSPIQGRPMLVVDPVMVSTSGHKLLEDDAISSVKEYLLPLALIITPNLPEASLLLGKRNITNLSEMQQAARDLCAMGPRWVLLKGGHLEGSDDATDVLCCRATGECRSFSAKFVKTSNTHGTGCTLASSIAARLAHGDAVEDAVREAKRYVDGAINASVNLCLGSGVQGPMNHMWEKVEW